MAQRKTDEVIINLKINNKQAATTLNELEGDARELKSVLKNMNPETDKAQIEKIKAEYEKVTERIGQVRSELGLLRKSQTSVETGANKIGEAFKQMATAAFWIALIQQAYELAKAFFEVQKEINGLQTQISKMTGASGKELDQMVGKTQGISKAFEVEAKEVNDAANSISKNMKISFAEAQDLIKQGLAASAETDKGELLQWYEEYASALSNTGIKADEFIAIVSQMKEQGVWDDFLIDGFKEFGIRASTDLGKVVAGLKGVEKATGTVFAEQMGKDIESGKISVMDALKQISGELAKLPPESNVAKQAISEVFGSKGEDLGAGVIQAFAKTKNATDYLNQSSKAYNSQLDQLIESQQTLSATQSELFGKMQSGGKMIDILTNKALTVLFRTMILVYENSQPLIDVWNEWRTASQNMATEIGLLLKSLGLFQKEGSFVKALIEGIATTLSLALLPYRLTISSLVSLSEWIRTSANSVSVFWDSLKLLYPSLQRIADLVNLFLDPWLKIPQAIGEANRYLSAFINKSDEAIRKRQEVEKVSGDYVSEKDLNGSKKSETVEPTESDRFKSDLEKRRAEELRAAEAEGKNTKPDNTKDTNSQAYQDYLQKQKDAKAKADEEAKKKAEEIAKAQAEIDKKLEEARLEAITNENERKIAQLEAQAKQEIEAFNKTNALDAQKAEYKRLVEEKLSKEVKEIRQKEMDELTAMARQQIIDEENAKKEVRETILKSNVELAQENLDRANQNVEKLDKPENELVDKTSALQAQFEAENALKQAQFDLELESLAGQDELKLALKTEFDNAELEATKAQKDALIAEEWRLATAKAQAIGVMFNAFSDSSKAIVELFGEQTEAGKVASAAMKAFSAGEIIANSIVEISEAWKYAAKNPINSIIPGAGAAIATAQTVGIVARKAKSLGELASIKFAKGGFLQGRSHSNGGIRGTGRFANIEVEGGEYITRKRATDLNLPVLEAINKYGDQIDFSSMLRFATGGQIPNTTPSSAVVEAIRTPEANPMGEAMLQAIIEMGQKLDSYEREKQVVVNYSNIESAGDKMAVVRDY